MYGQCNNGNERFRSPDHFSPRGHPNQHQKWHRRGPNHPHRSPNCQFSTTQSTPNDPNSGSVWNNNGLRGCPAQKPSPNHGNGQNPNYRPENGPSDSRYWQPGANHNGPRCPPPNDWQSWGPDTFHNNQSGYDNNCFHQNGHSPYNSPSGNFVPRGHRGGRPRMRGGYFTPGQRNDNNFNGKNGCKRKSFGNDGQNNSNNSSKKKKKEQSLPSSCPFYCSSCDKGYKLQELYDQHVQTHIKCGIEGCPYVAAARLVELHQEMQHRNGFAKKIWQLESKEDIEKWRAERRKNFPTKENIAKKEAMQKDKVARGEVLETKEFGKFGRGRGRGGRHRGRGRWRGRRSRQGDDQSEDSHNVEQSKQTMEGDQNIQVHSEVPQSGESNSTKPCPVKNPDTDPLSYILDEQEENHSKPSTPALSGALGSLMASYGGNSSASDEEEEETDQESSKITPNTSVNQSKLTEECSSDEEGEIKDDLCPEMESENHKATAISKPDPVEQPTHEKRNKNHNGPKNKRNRGKKGQAGNKNNVVSKRQLSLLEKLLAREIAHERNIILQCIRHIVKNKLFGVGTKNNNNDADKAADAADGTNTKPVWHV